MLPHSILEIMQLTDFFIGTKLRDLNEMCYVNEDFFCILSAVSLGDCYIIQRVGVFVDSSEVEDHSCVEQPGTYTLQFT